MRISDWSSDVCSSDLASRSTCRSRAAAGQDQPLLVPLLRVRGAVVCQLRRDPPRDGRADPRALPSLLWRLLGLVGAHRSEEHTSELQSLMRISYAVFCLKKKKT